LRRSDGSYSGRSGHSACNYDRQSVSTALDRGEHGTATSWRLGCRCGRCRAGLRRAAQVWWATRRLRAGADPASYVPAAKVRAHVAELVAAGWTRTAIAKAAQIAPSTITRICKPSTRWCSRIVARAVLGL
jgi:hypothetical protein